MKINEKMNLVMPIYDEVDNITAWVHSAPISREVFEAHFLLISKTFSAIYEEGLSNTAGPRVAALILRRIAKRTGDEENAQSLMNEIRRLTNVMQRTTAGWEMVPFQEVIDKKTIDDDDLAEVENAIVFFIVISSTHRKQVAAEVLPGAVKLWGAQTSSLGSSAFHASLTTSTAVEPTGASQKPGSSVVF